MIARIRERLLVDRGTLLAVGVAFAIRATFVIGYFFSGCTRDECTYRNLARTIVSGQGLTAPEGWLWAPGWPYILAGSIALTGNENYAKLVQLAAALATVVVLARIGRRVADERTGHIAAMLYAIHPTFAYFTGSLWSEVVYTFCLLGAVLALLRAREGGLLRSLLPGILVGFCVLFRGVATYMAPIFALAAVWPEGRESFLDGLRARWKHAAVLVVGFVLTVAPYTIDASVTHGGFIVSDATLGQMMWLGNNDFAPIDFDIGNGLLQTIPYSAHARHGRPHCPKSLPAAKWNACETTAGTMWIRSHPAEFARRIPLRLAQLLDPHTFFTRHLIWGKWPGVPYGVKYALIVYVALSSFAVVLGGTAAGLLRGRGPFGVLAAGIVAYHVAAIAMLAGLSRYRLPLEPFGLVFLAMAIAQPRQTLEVARSSPLRLTAAVLAVAALLPLMLWFLPTGFPGWW